MNIEELSWKHEIDTHTLKMMIKDHGSIENFCKKYINSLMNDGYVKANVPRAAEQHMVNYFNLSNPCNIGEYSGYARLLSDMLRIKPGFATLQPIEDLIRDTMHKVLDQFDIDLIKCYYKLDGKKKSDIELAMENGLRESEIVQIRKRSVKRLGVSVKTSKMQLLNRYIIDRDSVKEHLRAVMTPEDAFCSKKSSAILDRKVELVFSIMKEKIEELAFNGDSTYIFQSIDVKRAINESILSDEQKQSLICFLETRLKDIATSNKEKIVKLFEDKIEFAKQKSDAKQIKAVLRDIKKSGLDDATIEELTSKVPNELMQEKVDFGQFRSNIMLKIGFPYIDAKVENLRLSKKVKNALKSVGINSLGELIEFSTNELFKLGGMKRSDWQVVIDTIEQMGYDIPEDNSCPIISYNYDKMKQDNLQIIVQEIQDANFSEPVKSGFLDVVLQVSIDRLKLEYENLEKFVRIYEDVLKSRKTSNKEDAYTLDYSNRITEAENRMTEIKRKIDEIENR